MSAYDTFWKAQENPEAPTVFAVFQATQWNWVRPSRQNPTGIFCGSGHAANGGGNPHIPFPNSLRIRSISWQSSVKSANSEALFIFLLSPSGVWGGDGQVELLRVHHPGGPPNTVVRWVELPGSGIVVPAGWMLWTFGEGGTTEAGFAVPNGLEVQTAVYCTPA